MPGQFERPTRYKCANCGFIFDFSSQVSSTIPSCPKCTSNACDLKTNGDLNKGK